MQSVLNVAKNSLHRSPRRSGWCTEVLTYLINREGQIRASVREVL
jgi:hypothetical protein